MALRTLRLSTLLSQFLIFSALIIPSACKENSERVELSGTVEIKPHDSISIPDTSQEEINQKLSLSQTDDTLYVKFGNQMLFRTFIQPTIKVGGTDNNPQEEYDLPFYLAEHLIILRKIHSAGHFCHTPSVGFIDIYKVSSELVKKTELTGDYNPNSFQGNRFDSPNHTWGVITEEAEGYLYGLQLLLNTGELSYISLDTLGLDGQTYEAEFNQENELVWHNLKDSLLFILDSTGNFKFKPKI